jgi:choline kinase
MPAAIILAAGRGRRLGELTDERPKCLLRVGPMSLLEHQLEALAERGVGPVVVVTGYHAETVEDCVAGRALCLRNDRHDSTNSLYSLGLAREHARDGFVLLNADVLFDPEILQRVLDSPHPEALAVERRDSFAPEEMKVELDGARIRALSKQLEPVRAHAENVGVLKFSAEGAAVLFEEVERLLAAGHEREFAPFAFNAIAARRPLHAVPIEGLPWIEIDFVDDLLRAREEVWPAIRARRAERPISAALPASNPSTVLRN